MMASTLHAAGAGPWRQGPHRKQNATFFLQNRFGEKDDTEHVGTVVQCGRPVRQRCELMMDRNRECQQGPGDSVQRASLLEQVTPLARQINCLEIDRIAGVCIGKIPAMVGSGYASLYILDETSNILHLVRHNHPFPINKIVSISQSPPSPMVMAVKSKSLILAGNIDMHTKPVIRRSQRAFAENYKTTNCAIIPLICLDRVVGVLNLADKEDGTLFNSEDIALIELFGQLIGASIGNIKLF